MAAIFAKKRVFSLKNGRHYEHFEKLKSSITDSWGVYFGEKTSPDRSIDLIEKELIRLGVDRG